MTETKKTADQLRSARWFAPDDLRSFGHRSRMMQMGLGPEDWEGRPVIGILNTWSAMNPCHLHFRDRAEDVKKGIAQAGGLGLEIPTISIDESFTKPTSMLYRNMIAMETEETIRSHPLDGVVLMGGCDKSTPGLTMGAISAGVPFIFLPAGPMLLGIDAARSLRPCPDPWKLLPARRGGSIPPGEWPGVAGRISLPDRRCVAL